MRVLRTWLGLVCVLAATDAFGTTKWNDNVDANNKWTINNPDPHTSPSPGTSPLRLQDVAVGAGYVKSTASNGTFTTSPTIPWGDISSAPLFLLDPGLNGVVVRNGLQTSVARTLTGGPGVTITNPDGVAGNPVINVPTATVYADGIATGTIQLAAVAAAGLTQGTVAWVASVGDFFKLVPSTLTTTATTVITASGKAGYQWIRLDIGNPNWAAQATWFVDPANNTTNAGDENDGSSGHPLLTLAEMGRRLMNTYVTLTTITINLISNGATNDPLILTNIQTNGGPIIKIVGQTTTISSGIAITAARNPTSAGVNDHFEITTSASYTGWPGNYLLQRTNGTQAWFWPYKDLGGGKLQISLPLASNAVVQTLSPGDVISVLSLPTLAGVLTQNCSPTMLVNVQEIQSNGWSLAGNQIYEHVMDTAINFDRSLFAPPSGKLIGFVNNTLDAYIGLQNICAVLQTAIGLGLTGNGIRMVGGLYMAGSGTPEIEVAQSMGWLAGGAFVDTITLGGVTMSITHSTIVQKLDVMAYDLINPALSVDLGASLMLDAIGGERNTGALVVTQRYGVVYPLNTYSSSWIAAATSSSTPYSVNGVAYTQAQLGIDTNHTMTDGGGIISTTGWAGDLSGLGSNPSVIAIHDNGSTRHPITSIASSSVVVTDPSGNVTTATPITGLTISGGNLSITGTPNTTAFFNNSGALTEDPLYSYLGASHRLYLSSTNAPDTTGQLALLNIQSEAGGTGESIWMSATGGFWNEVVSDRSNGTRSAPTVVPAGGTLWDWVSRGYDGSAYKFSETWGAQVPSDATVSSGNVPQTFFIGTNTTGGNAANGAVNWALGVTHKRNVFIGEGNISTSATDGFPYLPAGAGPPTGVPTYVFGNSQNQNRDPLYIDEADKLVYAYMGGAWRTVGPAAAASTNGLGPTALGTPGTATTFARSDQTPSAYRSDLPLSTTWFVDPVNGSDSASNSGTSSATALKTMQELARRWWSAEIQANTTVNILGNVPGTDLAAWNFTVRSGITITFVGSLGATTGFGGAAIDNTVYSGSVTGFAAASATPAADDIELTDSAIPTSYTASGILANGVILKRTSSTALYWYALKDLGSKTVRITVPTLLSGQPMNAALTNGDTYSAYAMWQMPTQMFGAAIQNIVIDSLFMNGSSFSGQVLGAMVGATPARIWYGTRGMTFTRAGSTLLNVMLGSTSSITLGNATGVDVIFVGGGGRGSGATTVSANGCTIIMQGAPVFQGMTLQSGDEGFLAIESAIAFHDTTAPMLVAAGNGNLAFNSSPAGTGVSGKGNTNKIVNVTSNANFSWGLNTANPPFIAGVTTDASPILIGGISYAVSQIPTFTNTQLSGTTTFPSTVFETGGPTLLTFGALPNGSHLQVSGSSIVGDTTTYTPTTRTLTMTAPMTCDGGSSCDLSANRTIATPVFSGSSAGLVPPSGGSSALYLNGAGTYTSPSGTGANGLGSYWVSSSTNAPVNAVNFGGLANGVIENNVTVGVSTPTIFAVTVNDIPFGLGGGFLTQSNNFFYDGGKIEIDSSDGSGIAAAFHASGVQAIDKTGGIFQVGTADAHAFQVYVGNVVRTSWDTSGGVTIASLGTGLVKSTGGLLANASSSDITTAVTWPTGVLEGTAGTLTSLSVTADDIPYGNPAGGGLLTTNNNFFFDGTKLEIDTSDGSSNAITLAKAATQVINKHGGTLTVQTDDSHGLIFKTNATTAITINPSQQVNVSSLNAGGVVISSAGQLGIGVAGADYQVPITWPAATDVLVSSSTSTVPVGDSTFTYDTTNHVESAGAVQINGVTAPSNVSFILGRSSNADRDSAQFYLGGGSQGPTGTGDGSLFEIIPSTIGVIRAGVSGGIYSTQRIHQGTWVGVSSPTINEATSLYIDGAPGVTSATVGSGQFALHIASGESSFDGTVRILAQNGGLYANSDATLSSGLPGVAHYSWQQFFINSGFGLKDNMGNIFFFSGDKASISSLSDGVADPTISSSVGATLNNIWTSNNYPPLYVAERNFSNGGRFNCYAFYVNTTGSGTDQETVELDYTTNPASTSFTNVATATVSSLVTGSSFGTSFSTSVPNGALLFVAIYRTDSAASRSIIGLNLRCQAEIY